MTNAIVTPSVESTSESDEGEKAIIRTLRNCAFGIVVAAIGVAGFVFYDHDRQMKNAIDNAALNGQQEFSVSQTGGGGEVKYKLVKIDSVKCEFYAAYRETAGADQQKIIATEPENAKPVCRTVLPGNDPR